MYNEDIILGKLRKNREQLENILRNVPLVTTKKSINLFNKDSLQNVPGYYIKNSGEFIRVYAGSGYTHLIEVSAGDVFIFPSFAYFGTSRYAFFDASGNYIDFGTGYTDDLTNITFTVPATAGIKYMKLNYLIAGLETTMLLKGSIYSSTYIPYNLKTLTTNSLNPLQGKTALYDGDSFCSAGSAAGHGYAYLIGEANSMAYINYGVAGGTIANCHGTVGSETRHSVVLNIDSMIDDADYVILEGGVNDPSYYSALGAITADYVSALDETTFAGGMESVCKKALTKWKGKKIGFIMGWKTTGSVNADYQTLFALQRQILEKWNIPYIDLYKMSGLCLQLDYVDYNNVNYHGVIYSTDGWHLTAEGYAIVTPKIEAWMKTL